MLSPQKAPERLLQLADSNLESLIVEMDQLHSRVQKSLCFSTVCRRLSPFVIFIPPSHRKYGEANIFHTAGLWVMAAKKTAKQKSLVTDTQSCAVQHKQHQLTV